MDAAKTTTHRVTLVLTEHEFNAAVAIGEQTLGLLMEGEVIPHGCTQADDPDTKRDVAVLGLQELFAGWLARHTDRSCDDPNDPNTPF
ncbi:MAG: hypothetical protein AAGG56_12960 [Pseudomonadota bacterium]